MKAKSKKTVRLSDFVENPRNPSTATEADIERLAGKLRRVPLGLTAMRLAFVRDIVPGKFTVISGNKRLRVLKRAYGDDGEVPAEWFADVSAMSEAERHEFIITSNTPDGSWDLDVLMADYDRAELDALMRPGEIDELLDAVGTAAPGEGDADMEAFDDLESGDPASDEVKCMIGRLRIPITAEEAELVGKRYQEYVERETCGYGFFYTLLGVKRDGVEHSA